MIVLKQLACALFFEYLPGLIEILDSESHKVRYFPGKSSLIRFHLMFWIYGQQTRQREDQTGGYNSSQYFFSSFIKLAKVLSNFYFKALLIARFSFDWSSLIMCEQMELLSDPRSDKLLFFTIELFFRIELELAFRLRVDYSNFSENLTLFELLWR